MRYLVLKAAPLQQAVNVLFAFIVKGAVKGKGTSFDLNAAVETDGGLFFEQHRQRIAQQAVEVDLEGDGHEEGVFFGYKNSRIQQRVAGVFAVEGDIHFRAQELQVIRIGVVEFQGGGQSGQRAAVNDLRILKTVILRRLGLTATRSPEGQGQKGQNGNGGKALFWVQHSLQDTGFPNS